MFASLLGHLNDQYFYFFIEDWTSYESSVGIALLRWFYTDLIVSDDDSVTLGLLRAAHHFELPTLFEACESKLLSAINQSSSREFYKIAHEVNAKMIMEKCKEWKSTLDDITKPEPQLQIDVEDNVSIWSLDDFELLKLSSVSSRKSY